MLSTHPVPDKAEAYGDRAGLFFFNSLPNVFVSDFLKRNAASFLPDQ